MTTFARTDHEVEIENVRVAIRVRPFNKKELEENLQNIIKIEQDQKVISLTKSNLTNTTPKYFKFDRIFSANSVQLDLYKHIAYPIVNKILEGYNGTIFAYGQTGTGKTYTMMGDDTSIDCKGIIPNTFSHIFGQISRYGGEKSFVVTTTYLEIYNENVRDLLSQNRKERLEVRERSDLGVYVKGLMGFTIDSIESIQEILRLGNKNRTTKSTLMNRVSSRSHAIFTITIESKDTNENITTIAKLNLVDLAGSERLHKTGATGDRLKEATNINQSLSVLSSVISALVDGKSSHIPYRNSKLTRLLQDSLGGNSKTAMIATISPSPLDFEETVCTLRYASRVKHIKNLLKINIETKPGLIESFEEEITKLKRKISLINLRESKTSLKNKFSLDIDKIYEEELKNVKNEKEKVLEKIVLIQKKILVGGENLLEKAEQQMSLMEMSDFELENLNKSHQELEEQLQQKETEKTNVTKKYSNLQDAEKDLTEKIEIIQKMIDKSKSESIENKYDYQREIEIIKENSKALTKELQLANLLINNSIPHTYLKRIESNISWNNDITDFDLKGLQYTGNNTRKSKDIVANVHKVSNRNITCVYGSYKKKH